MARQSVKVFVHQRTSEMCEKFWTLSPETRVNIRTVGARKPPMMAEFQAEENLTGRAQKNVRKILDVIRNAGCFLSSLYSVSFLSYFCFLLTSHGMQSGISDYSARSDHLVRRSEHPVRA